MPAKPLPGSLEKPRRTSDLGFYWQKMHVLITGVELATGRGAPILFAPRLGSLKYTLSAVDGICALNIALQVLVPHVAT
jgi:hypothetical protein